MKLPTLKTFGLKVAMMLCVVSLVFSPLIPAFTPHKAEADFFTGTDWANLVQNTISAIAEGVVEGLSDALVQKEFTWDAIAWGIVNILLQQMLQDTIDWVNSGFRDKPVFVQDFKAYLLDVGDQYAYDFIFDRNLLDLCSPFSLDIQGALNFQYDKNRQGGYRAECRLSEAIGNVKNLKSFHDGDFIAGGGWDAWRDVITDSKLRETSAYMEASAAMSIGMKNARGQKLFEVNLGDGFVPQEDCVTDKKGRVTCTTKTPGATIKASLDKALGISSDRLTIADEINELFGALVSQFAKRILGGPDNGKGKGGGITGADSKYKNSPASSYLSDVGAAPQQQHSQVIDVDILEQEATQKNQEAMAAAVNNSTNQNNQSTSDIIQNDYIQLLNSAAQLINSCTGTIHSSQRLVLNSEIDDITSEVVRIVNGDKTVTLKDVEEYRLIEIPRITQLVDELPNAANCDI